jgi:N-acetylglucosamine-6-phosphate deacetylase
MSASCTFYAGQLYSGSEGIEQPLFKQSIYVHQGRVASICSTPDNHTDTPYYDYSDCIVAPGFIDLQVNGGGGVMFNDCTTLSSVQSILVAHRAHGTAYMLPTLISATDTCIVQARALIERSFQHQVAGILGIHLEGPFINPSNNGAHQQSLLRGATSSDLPLLQPLQSGKTLVTLAPELAHADVIDQLAASGVRVFIGHTSANYQQTLDALAHGAVGFTHLFNAMGAFSGREPGVIGAAISDPDSWCSIIVDGHHVHQANLKLALENKPLGKVFLVTDAMSSVGGPSKFTLDGHPVYVENGRCINHEGRLAGAHLGMNQAVSNCVSMLNLPLAQALRMASTYPAQVLGLESELGYIKAGYRASFTILSRQLEVKAVMIDGQLYPQHTVTQQPLEPHIK